MNQTERLRNLTETTTTPSFRLGGAMSRGISITTGILYQELASIRLYTEKEEGIYALRQGRTRKLEKKKKSQAKIHVLKLTKGESRCLMM